MQLRYLSSTHYMYNVCGHVWPCKKEIVTKRPRLSQVVSGASPGSIISATSDLSNREALLLYLSVWFMCPIWCDAEIPALFIMLQRSDGAEWLSCSKTAAGFSCCYHSISFSGTANHTQPLAITQAFFYYCVTSPWPLKHAANTNPNNSC